MVLGAGGLLGIKFPSFRPIDKAPRGRRLRFWTKRMPATATPIPRYWIVLRFSLSTSRANNAVANGERPSITFISIADSLCKAWL